MMAHPHLLMKFPWTKHRACPRPLHPTLGKSDLDSMSLMVMVLHRFAHMRIYGALVACMLQLATSQVVTMNADCHPFIRCKLSMAATPAWLHYYLIFKVSCDHSSH